MVLVVEPDHQVTWDDDWVEPWAVVALDACDLETWADRSGLSWGYEIAGDVLAATWPDVVVLVTPGAVKVQRTDLPENGQFVPKPYRGEHVAKLIDELVGAAA